MQLTLSSLLVSTLKAVLVSTASYTLFICLLTVPYFQNQVIYLNSVTLTWFKDLNIPEQWGFLSNQVTPFSIQTPDGETLQAWHVLPLELYRRHEADVLAQPAGFASDFKSRLNFKLLKDDPDALLIIYLHGAAGTLGSGYRPQSYRGLYSGASDRIHTVAIDYRGFGSSTGTPSEQGLLVDGLALADWAMSVAGIPPERIVVFGQSLGTAVSIALVRHLAKQPKPILLAGMVLVAPFADVATLTATYRVAGTIPILSPVARFPVLLSFLHRFIRSKWPSTDTLADFVRHCESLDGEEQKYHITLIHAMDDTDIPWSHSNTIFWHAVNASTTKDLSYEELERQKEEEKISMADGSWKMQWQAPHGVIRQEIATFGEHDKIMAYPIVSLAVRRAFESRTDERR